MQFFIAIFSTIIKRVKEFSHLWVCLCPCEWWCACECVYVSLVSNGFIGIVQLLKGDGRRKKSCAHFPVSLTRKSVCFKAQIFYVLSVNQSNCCQQSLIYVYLNARVVEKCLALLITVKRQGLFYFSTQGSRWIFLWWCEKIASEMK